jgi:hypothetical protein
MHYVILRDDDTCAFTPKVCLERLYRPFLHRGLPVNLAVIPAVNTTVRTPNGRLEGFLTSGSGPTTPEAPIGDNRELVDYLRSEPGYDIVHHGCHHDYFEFGITDRIELSRRLDEGTVRLREAGLREPAAFVAPYDRFSREAFLEVAERFDVISTGWFEARRLPVAWWPAYAEKKVLHHAHWRHDGTTLLSHPGCLLSFHHHYDEMLATVQRAVERSPLTVLVTHWWEYFREGRPDEPFIGVLHDVATWLSSRPDIRVITFRDLLREEIPLN